jgi:hypothetical protein
MASNITTWNEMLRASTINEPRTIVNHLLTRGYWVSDPIFPPKTNGHLPKSFDEMDDNHKEEIRRLICTALGKEYALPKHIRPTNFHSVRLDQVENLFESVDQVYEYPNTDESTIEPESNLSSEGSSKNRDKAEDEELGNASDNRPTTSSNSDLNAIGQVFRMKVKNKEDRKNIPILFDLNSAHDGIPVSMPEFYKPAFKFIKQTLLPGIDQMVSRNGSIWKSDQELNGADCVKLEFMISEHESSLQQFHSDFGPSEGEDIGKHNILFIFNLFILISLSIVCLKILRLVL